MNNRFTKIIHKPIGATMGFSGGAEKTPIVTVHRYNQPDSLWHGHKNLIISSGSQSVEISAQTLQAILEWASKE